MAGKLGGYSEIKVATDETQKICDTVKSQVESKTNNTYTEFRALEYRVQIVAGNMYLIKLHVGGSDYLHIYIFQSLDKTDTKLKRVEHHQDKDPLDPILPYH